MAILQPRAGNSQPAVPNYMLKNYLQGVWVSLKISCYPVTPLKSYITFLLGWTDTQKDRCKYHMGGGGKRIFVYGRRSFGQLSSKFC